jgi:hypothetical protein
MIYIDVIKVKLKSIFKQSLLTYPFGLRCTVQNHLLRFLRTILCRYIQNLEFNT